MSIASSCHDSASSLIHTRAHTAQLLWRHITLSGFFPYSAGHCGHSRNCGHWEYPIPYILTGTSHPMLLLPCDRICSHGHGHGQVILSWPDQSITVLSTVCWRSIQFAPCRDLYAQWRILSTIYSMHAYFFLYVSHPIHAHRSGLTIKVQCRNYSPSEKCTSNALQMHLYLSPHTLIGTDASTPPCILYVSTFWE